MAGVAGVTTRLLANTDRGAALPSCSFFRLSFRQSEHQHRPPHQRHRHRSAAHVQSHSQSDAAARWSPQANVRVYLEWVVGQLRVGMHLPSPLLFLTFLCVRTCVCVCVCVCVPVPVSVSVSVCV